jgi:hypothetical protein
MKEEVGYSVIDAIRCSIVFGSLIDPSFEDLNCRVCEEGSTTGHPVTERRADGEFSHDDAGIGFAGDNGGAMNASA